MKNTAILSVIGVIFLSVILGPSRIIPGEGSSEKRTGNSQPKTSDNKTIGDRGLDVALGDEKTGVPECDDAADYFNQLIDEDNPDENFATKAIKRTIMNGFKSQFKKAIEDSKSDKTELARVCKDFKNNLIKYKEEDDNKNAGK